MSLYRHMPNRRAVLTEVVNEHFRMAMADLDPGHSWNETLRWFALAYRRTLLEHPRAVPLLATHPRATRDTVNCGVRPWARLSPGWRVPGRGRPSP